MADGTTNEDQGIPAVALPAGSFDLGELEKALGQATSVKNRAEHPRRINDAIAKTIAQPEILAAIDAPAVPNGASLVERTVDREDGRGEVTFETPAFDPVDAKSGAEAAKMSYEPRGEVSPSKGAATPSLAAAASDVVDAEAPTK